jgi:hypothetical protein
MTKIIGITGSVGKTTTMWVASSILSNLGYKVATIGTSSVRVNNKPYLCYNQVNSETAFKNIKLILMTLKKQNVDFLIIENTFDNIAKKTYDFIKFDYKFLTELALVHKIGYPKYGGDYQAYCKIKQDWVDDSPVVIKAQTYDLDLADDVNTPVKKSINNAISIVKAIQDKEVPLKYDTSITNWGGTLTKIKDDLYKDSATDDGAIELSALELRRLNPGKTIGYLYPDSYTFAYDILDKKTISLFDYFKVVNVRKLCKKDLTPADINVIVVDADYHYSYNPECNKGCGGCKE